MKKLAKAILVSSLAREGEREIPMWKLIPMEEDVFCLKDRCRGARPKDIS